MRIEVRGKPAPQGSKRHVGHGIMIESSKAVGPWREAVRAETQRAMLLDPLAMNWTGPALGPVYVSLRFEMIRPKSHYRTGRNAHLLRDGAPSRPFGGRKDDIDKLARAVLDGLTEGGAWKDDSQVVVLAAEKCYAPQAGCVITVTELED